MKTKKLLSSLSLSLGLFFSLGSSVFADGNFITSVSDLQIYDLNSTDSPVAGLIAPQKLGYLKEENGYYQIPTWLGLKWIHPGEFLDSNNQRKLLVSKNVGLYEEASFKSVQDGEISPQTVTVLNVLDDGWYQIKTYLGPRYVTLQSEPKKPSKVAYITFDDGPSRSTPQLLDTLNKYGVKATFFMIEPNMRTFPDYVRRMKEEGDYTGLHSVSHSIEKLYRGSPDNVAKEMKITEETLQDITGDTHVLARAPYGSKPYMTQEFRDYMVDYGFKMWDWNIDSEDWKYGEDSKEQILINIQNQVSNLRSSKPPVILMHDRKPTVDELPAIIEYLQSLGYELITYDPSNHFVMNFWGDDRL